MERCSYVQTRVALQEAEKALGRVAQQKASLKKVDTAVAAAVGPERDTERADQENLSASLEDVDCPSPPKASRSPQCPHARAVGHVGRRRCLQFHLGERRKRERQLQHGGGAAARSRQVFCGTPHNTAERWPCCGAEADSGALGPATGPPCALRCTLIFFDRCSTWAPTSAMNA